MTLVVAIGGVRSGKSAWAEDQAHELAGSAPVTVLATADPTDPSMQRRIERHRGIRPANWPVVDLHGSDGLAVDLPEHGVVLLDGLGGWVASVLDRAGAFSEDRATAQAGLTIATGRAHDAVDELITAAASTGRSVIVVTEETGLGVVPLGAGTAAWVDLVGELNQRLVQHAQLAVVVVAGRALPLSDSVAPLRRTDAGPPLSVMPGASSGLDGAPAPDRERRAHPRLMGAGPAVRRASTTPTPGEPGENDLSAAASIADASLAALREHGDRLVRPGDADHAVNVDAQGPPSWLTDALAGVLLERHLTHYPDVSIAEQALAKLYGREAAEVVATNGAAQALWLLPAALRPRLAACVHPLFTEAEAALRAHGVPVVRVHRAADDDFAIDPDAVPETADLVVVGNPAAASGTLAARESVLALRRPGRTLVVDEAFIDMVPGETESVLGSGHDDVIVVRSFTKSLSVPGLRCGAAITSPALATRLRDVRPPWSVNAFAIAAMTALAAHPDELVARAERAQRERADLVEGLASLPDVRIWPSAANHVLIQVPSGPRVTSALRAARIAVRPCGSFPGLTDDHLRLTARDSEANARLVAALAEALATPPRHGHEA